MTEEWSFGDDNFDFIHIRMLGDLTHKTRLVQSIYDNLNPGGWVEFTEWIVQLQSPNHSLDGSAFRRWNCLLRQGTCTTHWSLISLFLSISLSLIPLVLLCQASRAKQGRAGEMGGERERRDKPRTLPQPSRIIFGGPPCLHGICHRIGVGLRNLGSSLYYPNEYKPLLRKAGFENIHETRNGALTNPCYPGRRLQKVGAMMTTNWRTILEPLTMPVFTNALGWTEDEVRALCKEVNREIGDTRYHSFMTLYEPFTFSCSLNPPCLN